MRSCVDNDPFFAQVVRDFHRNAHRRHRKFPLLRTTALGFALCPLPPSFDEYFMLVEGAARRNYKKAVREGCHFRRILFNDHLDGVRDIRQSTAVRQGRAMPASYLRGEVQRCTDPPSRNPLHDYPYFGVFAKDQLVAYASCLLSGEVCLLEHILGHAAWFEQNVVPYLIIEIAKYIYAHHPSVKYYGYGTYFGAGETLRRFKRKFGFLPHRVDWQLGDVRTDAAPAAVL